MADGNQSHDWQATERDSLDRELDAALAKYAAVEPRTGLENRVLANLGAERSHAAERVWWRWPALAVTAAMLVVAVAGLRWRLDRSSHEITAHRPTTSAPIDTRPGVKRATKNTADLHSTASVATKKPARCGVRHDGEIVAGGPRLDRFPSPRPLSEEEKLLVRYVHDFPQEAVMVAKAQQQSEIEMEELSGNDAPASNPVQQQGQQQDHE